MQEGGKEGAGYGGPAIFRGALGAVEEGSGRWGLEGPNGGGWECWAFLCGEQAQLPVTG